MGTVCPALGSVLTAPLSKALKLEHQTLSKFSEPHTSESQFLWAKKEGSLECCKEWNIDFISLKTVLLLNTRGKSLKRLLT